MSLQLLGFLCIVQAVGDDEIPRQLHYDSALFIRQCRRHQSRQRPSCLCQLVLADLTPHSLIGYIEGLRPDGLPGILIQDQGLADGRCGQAQAGDVAQELDFTFQRSIRVVAQDINVVEDLFGCFGLLSAYLRIEGVVDGGYGCRGSITGRLREDLTLKGHTLGGTYVRGTDVAHFQAQLRG